MTISHVAPSLTIDGRAVRADVTAAVLDPATEETIAHVPVADRDHLDQAVASAVAAFPGWRDDPAGRRTALLRAADVVHAAATEIGQLVSAETGKPLAEGVAEARGLAAFLRYNAGLEPPRTQLADDEDSVVEVVHRPLGPVGAIVPWNAPIYVLGLKISPALAAGCTVVVKPSPYTPVSALRVGELLCGVLPDGVLNVVSGGNDLGAAMTAHPGLRKITLTGSTATGRRVLAGAAEGIRRVTLELGGNDPAILLDDVDLDIHIERLFWAAFRNAGQTCVAVKRVYVPEHLHDRVVTSLAALAADVRVGPGSDPDNRMGPLTTPVQLALVSELVDDAVAAGARLAAGGARLDRPGYFYPPTVLGNCHDGMRVVDEEQFGPVLPVVPYRHLDAVLGVVNGGEYGLGASVWSRDVARAGAIADRLEVGLSWVNTHRSTLGPAQPTHGWKQSGLGVEKGMWGLLAFTEMQVRYTARR